MAPIRFGRWWVDDSTLLRSCHPCRFITGRRASDFRRRLRSALDVDLVDVEGDEDRLRQRSTARSYWADPSSGRKDEAREIPVVVAVVGGARPSTDRICDVVVPADQTGIVDVERLPLRVRVWMSGGKLTSRRRHCSPASDHLSPSVTLTPSRIKRIGDER